MKGKKRKKGEGRGETQNKISRNRGNYKERKEETPNKPTVPLPLMSSSSQRKPLTSGEEESIRSSFNASTARSIARERSQIPDFRSTTLREVENERQSEGCFTKPPRKKGLEAKGTPEDLCSGENKERNI